jgi:hypothetical protein
MASFFISLTPEPVSKSELQRKRINIFQIIIRSAGNRSVA